jgi:hypothetical protein
MRLRYYIMASLAMGVWGCSDSLPTAPTSARETTQAAKALSSSGEVSLQDDIDGTIYTLNVHTREIKVSDGRVLVLTEEQTATARALFEGTVESDPAAAEFERLTRLRSPSDCTFGCVAEPFSRYQERIGVGKGLGRFGERTILRRKTAPMALTNTASYYGDTCSEAFDAAVDIVLGYRQHRLSFLKDVLPVAIAEAVNGIRFYLPPGSIAAAKLVSLAAINEKARIQLAYVSYVWNSNHCSTRPIQVPYVIMTTGGSSIGTRICTEETLSVSLDGGLSWHTVTVSVCHYL